MTSTNPVESLQVAIEDFRQFHSKIMIWIEEFTKWFEDRCDQMVELQATKDKIHYQLCKASDAIRLSIDSVPAATKKDLDDLWDCFKSLDDVFMSLQDTLFSSTTKD